MNMLQSSLHRHFFHVRTLKREKVSGRERERQRQRNRHTETETNRDREQNTFSWFKNIHQQDDIKPGSESEPRLNLYVLLAVLHCKSR